MISTVNIFLIFIFVFLPKTHRILSDWHRATTPECEIPSELRVAS